MTAPLFLVLPLWGQVRVDDFLALGAPMLLASGNLPAVSKKRPVVIAVYTTADDWQYLDRHPRIAALRNFAAVKPALFNPRPDVSKHITMSQGHHVMLEAASLAGALAVPIFADSLFADGDLTRLLALAKPGRRFVMVLGWRVSYEDCLPRLPADRVVTPRELVRLALHHRHSQMRCWSAANPGYGDDILGGPQWNIGADGVVTHSIYWEPALVDFSHDWPHDSRPIEEWTIDGHYPWANITDPSQYYAVTDSDEFFHLTFARETGPLAYHFDHTPMARSLVEEMIRARGFRSTDPLRQVLYEQRFRLHAQDIDRSWAAVEGEVDKAVIASRVPIKPTYSLTEHAPPSLIGPCGPFNLVRYEGEVYAISLALGPLAMDHAEHRARDGVERFASEGDARASIARRFGVPVSASVDRSDVADAAMPRLVQSVRDINLVSYLGRLYTVPQGLGPLDLDRSDHRKKPGVGEFPDETAARSYLRQIGYPA